MRDHLRAHAEGLAHFLVDDQVNVALAVALLGVGEAVVLVRQRAQRLGQQAHAVHVDVQVALAAARQGALGGDDVAQVPALHRFEGLRGQRLAVDVDLQAAAAVLQHHEGAAVEHDAPSHLDLDAGGFQLFLGLVGVLLLQHVAEAVAAEVVGEGNRLGFAQRGKFFLALGDQLVLFLMLGMLVQRLFAHGLRWFLVRRVPVSKRVSTSVARWPRRIAGHSAGVIEAGPRVRPTRGNRGVYSPCFRLASRYSSMSPSSTLSQSLRSMLVRRSLIRD